MVTQNRRTGRFRLLWLKAPAVCGFGVSLLYSVLSIFPIIDVENWATFAAQILAVLVATELVGLAIYRAGRRRLRDSA